MTWRLVGLALLAFGSGLGCGQTNGATATSGDDGGGVGVGNDAGAASCTSCSATSACGAGAACAQLTGEAVCLRPCPQGNECAASESCQSQSSLTGEPVQVCVPQRECGIAPPSGDAGPPVPYDGGGGTVSGNVGPDGGTAARLLFVSVGDTRGQLPITSSYPTDTINQIFTKIEALSPHPLFVVSTGDYAFELASDTSAQLDLYMAARKKYSGTFFPAMGNHECTWLTTSNCGAGNADGVTPQYTAYTNKLLAPLGKAAPYYTIHVDATDGSWTSKFVFVAANAWNDAQGTWLDGELAKPTTYTFVLRHEPKAANTAPGVTPSEAILAKHPYTLLLVGHTHTYSRSGKEVMFGNGGAPKADTKNWGFGVFSQRPDGAIQVDAIDYQTGLADSSFSFAVKPDGSAAP
jgi:Calcineurin-like phosphoesterase